MPVFKAFRDHLTLLLGGNVTGFKLKSFLMYHLRNPEALKNVNKNTLPIITIRKLAVPLFEDFKKKKKTICHRQENIVGKTIFHSS